MRILKVKGVGDALVTNPHAERSIRFVGKLWSAAKAAEGLSHPRCFDNVEETIADHQDLRSAVKKGDLAACDEVTAKLCGLKPAGAPAAATGAAWVAPGTTSSTSTEGN